MTIAIDFDGTIVEHRYPEIGKEIPFATATLKLLIAEGHKLILWSVREGDLLKEAVEWCSARGVEFYAVNTNHPEIRYDADEIVIYEMIHSGLSLGEYYRKIYSAAEPKRSFWDRLKK